MPKTPAELLTRAGDILAKYWGQDNYYDYETQCFCAVGALRQATHGSTAQPLRAGHPAYYEAIDALAALVNTDWLGEYDFTEDKVIDWNDKPGRTQAEVVGAFRQASLMAAEL